MTPSSRRRSACRRQGGLPGAPHPPNPPPLTPPSHPHPLPHTPLGPPPLTPPPPPALSYLERQAAYTRLGTDGHTAERCQGFVAAAFRHRMSRAGDPQLHTHVLVANLLNTADGRWLSLDGQRLYRRAKTAGYLYQAQLRFELSAELGLSFREVRRGAAEVEGVPDETLRTFSRRRAEVEAQMSDRGAHSAKAAQIAALSTRKAKDRGLDVNNAPNRMARSSPRERLRGRRGGSPPRPACAAHRGESRPSQTSKRGLTAKRSTFARRHVMEELAGAHRRGASCRRDRGHSPTASSSRSRVVELGAARPGECSSAYAPSEPIYTTREVLALEDRLGAPRRGPRPAAAWRQQIGGPSRRRSGATRLWRRPARTRPLPRQARGRAPSACSAAPALARRERLRPLREAL